MSDQMDGAAGFAQLTALLGRWERRRRLVALAVWLPRGVLAGALAGCLVAAAAWLRPILLPRELMLLLGGLLLAALLLTLGAWLFQRHTVPEQARFADRQFGLQERAATAVAIAGGAVTAEPALARRQLQDTLRAAAGVDAARGLPLRLVRRDWLLLAAALALLTLALVLPNPQSGAVRAQRELAAAVAEQVAALEELVDDIAAASDLSAEDREALTEPLNSALEQLREGDLSREELVAALSEAEADLRALRADRTVDLQAQLDAAGAPLAQSRAGAAMGSALQAGDLAGAARAAFALADELATLSAAEQAELAQALLDSAESLQTTDPALAAQLSAAAAALQNGDLAAAQDALREAAATLQERAASVAAAQAAGAAADQLAEGRQSVAQAGQPGTTAEGAAGQSGSGQADSGTDGSAGDGQPGSGSGSGQTDGAGSGQEPGSQSGDGSGGPGPGGGHAERVFVPDSADLGDAEGVDVELPAECLANPAACGQLISESPSPIRDEQSRVPYDQVYGDYRDAAYEALEDDYIPLGMKDLVRDYFSSLEP